MRLKTANPADYIKRVVDFRKSIFDKIAGKDSNQVWLKASFEDVKRVVLINSASRAGSSLLFAILRRIPQIYSLSGESTPFYKLNGLSSDYFSSDRIPDELTGMSDNDLNMSRDFLSDFSVMTGEDDIVNNKYSLDQFIDNLILRFSMQWPQVKFSYAIFKKLANEAVDIYAKKHRRFDKEKFYLELLGFLKREYPPINPYYYDIPQDMIKEKFPDIEIPICPPNDTIMIEEPPFILLSPCKKVGKEDLSGKILLLKSTVDCYRMNYIKTLFPNARMEVIYLTRNPAASINGLYDGWLYRGFFSHNLKLFFRENNAKQKRLKISGYSNKYEWGKWWWNFDLPPGWQDYAESRLEQVCAFQWYSANKNIHEYINNDIIRHYQVKYENIVGNLKLRYSEIKKITDFIGIDKDIIETLGLDRLPVIQATQSPQFYRWKKRKDIILPLLNDSKVSKMCSELGYDKENLEEWL